MTWQRCANVLILVQATAIGAVFFTLFPFIMSFSSLFQSRKARTEFEITLSRCSYTGAFLSVHEAVWNIRAGGLSWNSYDFCVNMMLILSEIALFLFSIACQIGFTYYLNLQMQPPPDVCTLHTSRGLQWLGAAAFVGKVLQDVFETCEMLLWFLVADRIEKDLAGDQPESIELSDRVAGILFVVLPKFAIAGWLTWVGARFVLLSSDDTQIIVNCLAMTFVMDIDEIVHKTASSQYVKQSTEHLKAWSMPLKPEYVRLETVMAPVIKAGLWAFACLVLIADLPRCNQPPGPPGPPGPPNR
ncbi:unnamed protein product [Durusdinium trenchii]|uniref:Uncharacterized protein n=1 Tax=Durusdinium trenchii TaxID=1381693 RepID=A0ABP0PZF7_9DINO